MRFSIPLCFKIVIFLSIKDILFMFKLATGTLKFLFFPAARITAFFTFTFIFESICN